MRKTGSVIATTALFVTMVLFGVYCGLNPGAAYLEADTQRCTGCGECASVCTVDAIRIVQSKAIIDPTKCVTCGRCVEACPVNAIQ